MFVAVGRYLKPLHFPPPNVKETPCITTSSVISYPVAVILGPIGPTGTEGGKYG